MQSASTQPATPDSDPGALNAWLMFLGIHLLCVRPIFELAQGIPLFKAINAMEPAMPLLKWSILAIMAACFALNIAAGVLLFSRRRPSTVKIVHLALWLAGPVAGALMLAITLWAKDLPFSSLLDTSAPDSLLRSLAAATGWTLYLVLAGHVKVRYGDDATSPRAQVRESGSASRP